MTAMIECENNFCIYWETNRCTLNSITRSVQGTCSALIDVTIEACSLQEKRATQRAQYEQLY